MRRSVDLRLWATAVTVWLGSAATVLSAAAPMAVIPWAICAIALGFFVVWRYFHARRLVLLLPIMALAFAALISSIRVAAVTSPLLPEPGHIASFEAVVDTDPRVIDGRVSGIVRGPLRVVVAVTLLSISDPDSQIEGRLPARVWFPSEARDLIPGSVIRARGVVSPGDAVDGVSLVLTCRQAPDLVSGPPVWHRVAARLRAGLRLAVEDVSGASGEGAALLPGLVLGDTSMVSDDVTTDMRTAGLSHLTAVSGANVSIVLSAALVLAALLRIRGRARAVLAGAALVGFLILVRPSPSVVRATAMGGVVVLALLVGGQRRGSSALAAAVTLLVLIDPWLSISPGFALSVVATGALLLLAPRVSSTVATRVPRLPRPVCDAVAVTVSAQICTAPILLAIGAPVGVGSIPANLAAAPVVAPATVLGVLATLVSLASPALAHVIAIPAVGCAQWIVVVAREISTAAPLTIPWPTGLSGATTFALTLTGIGAAWTLRRRWFPILRVVPRSVIAAGVASAVLLAAALPRAATSTWPPPEWVAVFCDVGQGDAAVLNAGDGAVVVVDAGPAPAVVNRCLRDLGVGEVSALILTHFHADHVEGMPGVVRGRRVGDVLVSPLTEPPDQVLRVNSWASQANLPVTAVSLGDERQAGNVHWRVLWPGRIIRGEGSDANNSSITVLADVNGVRILLGGDLEPAAQAALMAAQTPPDVDILKVPHHGSGRQNIRFAPWSGARAAVVSVGVDNPYGHPAAATLSALRDGGLAVWRTDEAGDIAVVRRGSDIVLVAHHS